MAQLNVRKSTSPIFTHGGAKASRFNAWQQLSRTVLTCMLWEGTFYEDGVSVADRIKELVPRVPAQQIVQLAITARTKMNLRHVPLLLIREMARYPSHRGHVADALFWVIQRPDEMPELLSIYWKDGRVPIANSIKKGLEKAFRKFSRFELAKWNKRKKDITLRDVLRAVHPKPLNQEQETLWGKVISDKLRAPDTWERRLSAGANKRQSWTDLLQHNKLGALALLRNLRNMHQEGVSTDLIKRAISRMNPDKVLPFRFITAARYAPALETELEEAMFRSLSSFKKLLGHTVLLLDVSQSMEQSLSDKSELTRLDAACGLAMLLREVCENVSVVTFSFRLKHVPSRRGFALRDAIVNSQPHYGTPLGEAVKFTYEPHTEEWFHPLPGYRNMDIHYKGLALRPDRIIVLTDEQSTGELPLPHPKHDKSYVINVAPYHYGVSFSPWVNISGWSEAIVSYIQELELFDTMDIHAPGRP